MTGVSRRGLFRLGGKALVGGAAAAVVTQLPKATAIGTHPRAGKFLAFDGDGYLTLREAHVARPTKILNETNEILDELPWKKLT